MWGKRWPTANRSFTKANEAHLARMDMSGIMARFNIPVAIVDVLA